MKEYQYFDAVDYFQKKLNVICMALGIDGYNVSAERKLDAVNAREVVISAMAGPVGAATATITYEISVYTNVPDEVMNMLNELARTESGKTFTSEMETTNNEVLSFSIIPSYMTPTIMDRDLEIGPNHGARVIQYASFGILANVLDVKDITYKGEKVEVAQSTLNFVAQLSANNKSGENLMKSTSTGAALSLSLTIPSQSGLLALDIISVMAGAKDKNYQFNISLRVGDENGVTIDKTYIMSTATINSVRGSVPSLQATFAEYDE
jgi:hypothetical protein